MLPILPSSPLEGITSVTRGCVSFRVPHTSLDGGLLFGAWVAFLNDG